MNLESVLRDVLSSVSLDRRRSPWAEVVALLSHAFPDSVGLFYSLAATDHAPSVDRLVSSHRALLQRIGRILREHLCWEAKLQRSEFVEAGVVACLESLGSAAALVDARGTVQADNLLLRQQGGEVRRRLAQNLKRASRGQHSRFAFKRLQSTSGTHWVAIEQSVPPLKRLPWELTTRERQVLDGVMEGQTNRAIAVRLEISERTVETYVTRLLHRTGSETRAALVVACLRADVY